MVAVKVLGPGCVNCERVEQHAARAIASLSAEYPKSEVQVEKVTDITQFSEYGLLKTPGLVIDGTLVASGRIPAEQEIAGWLREALYAEQVRVEN